MLASASPYSTAHFNNTIGVDRFNQQGLIGQPKSVTQPGLVHPQIIGI